MRITSLKPNERFVFGSNKAGRHGKGAALQAYKQFGAEYGVGEGLTGQCYALPTLDKNFHKLPDAELRWHIAWFLNVAEQNPQLTFLLTKVGCRLAGYDEEYIKGIFLSMGLQSNVVMPDGWLPPVDSSESLPPVNSD